MIDTATVYQTEEGVGLGVKRAIDEGLVRREDVFIMTKLPPYDQSVEKVNLHIFVTNLESNQPTSIADGRDDRGESKGPSIGISGLRAHSFSGSAKGFQPTE